MQINTSQERDTLNTDEKDRRTDYFSSGVHPLPASWRLTSVFQHLLNRRILRTALERLRLGSGCVLRTNKRIYCSETWALTECAASRWGFEATIIRPSSFSDMNRQVFVRISLWGNERATVVPVHFTQHLRLAKLWRCENNTTKYVINLKIFMI